MRNLSIAFVLVLMGSMADADQVTTGIWRGPRPSGQDLQDLKSAGVKTIINLQGGDLDGTFRDDFVRLIEPGEAPAQIQAEKILTLNLGMNFFNFPLSSMDDVKTKEKKLVLQALKTLADPTHQPVYVHCEHGVDRTGLVIALYRVYYQGWTPEQAHAEWARLGHEGPMKMILNGELDEYFFRVTAGSSSLAKNP